MFCISCGAALPEGAAFCPACGTRVAGTAARPGAPVPAVCALCGGSLKRVGKGAYRCEYCGSSFFAEGYEASASEDERDARLIALLDEAAGYERQNDYRTALQVLVKGLDFAPDSCTLMLRLGRACWKLGYDLKAQGYYRRAEALNPDDPIVYVNQGTLYSGREEYTRAKPLYEKSIALIEADPFSASPDDIAITYANYALCIGMLGDREGAMRCLTLASEKGYRKESVRQICSRLQLDPASFS